MHFTLIMYRQDGIEVQNFLLEMQIMMQVSIYGPWVVSLLKSLMGCLYFLGRVI